MTYEPYEPGGSSPADSSDSAASAPSYDVYDPAKVNDYSGGSTLRSPAGSRPTPYARSSTSTSSRPGATVGGVIGGLIGLVAVAVGVAQGNQADFEPVGPTGSSYSSCALEHDESSSLFTDAEWCDLELNGGNGDGLGDEDPYGLDDDPFGLEDDPYGYDDGSSFP